MNGSVAVMGREVSQMLHRGLMHRIGLALVAAVSACALVTGAVGGGPASFEGLGSAPGGAPLSQAHDISADGTTIVGQTSTARGNEAFKWAASEGYTILGTLPGAPVVSSVARAANADGTVIVGSSSSAFGTRAFRWTEADGMVDLGSLPGQSTSVAYGVSADGSVVVGQSGTQPFRWTSETGMVAIQVPNQGVARGVSDDGTVVTGWYVTSNGFDRAYRWTVDGGFEFLQLLFTTSQSTRGLAVNADGRYIGGAAHRPWGPIQAENAARWLENSSIFNLDFKGTPDGMDSAAMAVSSDGMTAVGFRSNDEGLSYAFLWRGTTLRPLSDAIEHLGIDLAGWTLRRATGVSADGTVIVGFGTNPDGQTEAFRIVYPHVEKAPVTGSCQGMCGQSVSGTCWCDVACLGFHDCCPDFCDVCDGMCGCGGLATGACCQDSTATHCIATYCCSATCDIRPSCCTDVWDECCSELASRECLGCASRTCFGFCGGQSPGGCWCDEACAGFADCCEDLCSACPNTSFCGLWSNASCEGNCGSVIDFGFSTIACWCDHACGSFNDCCADACIHCPELAHCFPVPADLNNDNFVNVFDLLLLLGAWGACPEPDPNPCPLDPEPHCPADLNGDGFVNVFDLLLLLSAWGHWTCEGSCGTQAPVGCWCDEDCCNFNDCCPDHGQHCEPCAPPPDPVSSCDGHCGGQAPDGCWCDSSCVPFTDCCDDACAVCGHCN